MIKNKTFWVIFVLGLCHRCTAGSLLGSSRHRKNGSNYHNPINVDMKNSENNLALHHGGSRTLLVTKISRGGGESPIQPNPSYVDYNQYMSPTLGDDVFDRNNKDGNVNHGTNINHIRRPFEYQQNNGHYQQQQQQQYSSYSPQQGQQRTTTLKPIQQVIQEFMKKVYISSPTIFYGIVSSATIFILWQIPPFTSTLQRHFVCNKHNIIRNHRYHTLLSSAISHNSVTHLLMNLYGFYIFGNNVEHILQMNNLSLSAYCIASAIISNLFFMCLTPNGSCIGLSGVSLSLLALDAKLHPSKELQFLLRFIPIRLPAHYALIGLFAWSTLGVVNSTFGGIHDGVAHSVHLGGLIFGVAVYELLKRGIYRKYSRIANRLLFDFKRKYGTKSRL